MKENQSKKKILVIHGPNMNLISYRPIAVKGKMTLDKINNCLKKEAKTTGHNLKVIQTNDEGTAVMYIQRQRNKIFGIVIFPGPWQKSAHIIKDTLEIIKIPFITVSIGEKLDLLRGINNFKNKDLLKSCRQAIKQLTKSV
mgnify:CR=1 FL=1